VVETPPLANTTGLPGPFEDDPVWINPTAAGKTAPAKGGVSFIDAPVLEPGSYTDSIVQGETLTYQVNLDWGQQLNAQAKFPRLDEQHKAAVAGMPLATLAVYGPARAPVSRTGSPFQTLHFYTNIGPFALSTAVGPVRALNPQASIDDEVRATDLAGPYTIVVFLSRKSGGRSIPIPFRLDLGVTGNVNGAPTYASATPIASDTESASPSGSGTPTASTTPSGDAANKPQASSQANSDSGGMPVVVWAALGLLLLAVLVIGAAIMFRLGKRSSGPPRCSLPESRPAPGVPTRP
jgi:Ca-activated chloride channel family protein